MKLLEGHNQTGVWSIDFEAYADPKGQTRWRLCFTLNRRLAHAIDAIGHYYVLQTNLPSESTGPELIQQYYKSLMTVERCFRIAKTSLEIRPIRHWKKNGITAHIYLNYLCMWLVKYIEKQWRQKGCTDEVVPTLRCWDDALRYNELLDKQHKKPLGYEWTRGERARQIIQEIENLGETNRVYPKLQQLHGFCAEVELLSNQVW